MKTPRTALLAALLLAAPTLPAQAESRHEIPWENIAKLEQTAHPHTDAETDAENRIQALQDLRDADSGNAASQYHTGLNYWEGKYLPINEVLAMRYLVRAAQQGHVPASLQISEWLNKYPEVFLDTGVKMPNGTKATQERLTEIHLSLLRDSADLGSPLSLVRIADIFLKDRRLALQEIEESVVDGPLHVHLGLENENLAKEIPTEEGLAQKIAAYAYYTLAYLQPPLRFLQTPEDRERFQEARKRSEAALQNFHEELTLPQIRLAQAHSHWIFQRILRNTTDSS